MAGSSTNTSLMYRKNRKTPKLHVVVALTVTFVVCIQFFTDNVATDNHRRIDVVDSGPESIAATENTLDNQIIDAHFKSLSGSGSISVLDDMINDGIEPESDAESIVAIITTAEMGTEDIMQMVAQSYKCDTEITKLKGVKCNDSHRIFRTHAFDVGVAEVQEHRKRHPEGQCLIATGLRSPASWFAAAYLRTIEKNDWKPKEEMIRDFKEFLDVGMFKRIHKVLPDLITEFNIGSLVTQVKIMNENQGYSLIPAPPSSSLSGCNLLFLQMEQIDQWPDFFHMSDLNNIESLPLLRQPQQHPDVPEAIEAIEAYVLTSHEKVKIYDDGDMFTQDWFSAYKYINVLPENHYPSKNVLPASYAQQNYCAIDFSNGNRECLEKMSPKLKSAKFWHFFGDSQMGRLYQQVKSQYPYEGALMRGGSKGRPDRCAALDYCQMERSAVWTPPDFSLSQGPVNFGLDHPWCTDIAGFEPTMWGSEERSIELYPVEYAKDVAQQTPDTKTSQETLTLCLKQRNSPRDDNVCVVNTGIHDQKFCFEVGGSCHYVENIRWYLNMLDSVCGHIVWIGTSSVLGESKLPQSNDISVGWNQEVASFLASSYPDTSFVVDVWAESLTHARTGNIHFEHPYYIKFAPLFTSLM